MDTVEEYLDATKKKIIINGKSQFQLPLLPHKVGVQNLKFYRLPSEFDGSFLTNYTHYINNQTFSCPTSVGKNCLFCSNNVKYSEFLKDNRQERRWRQSNHLALVQLLSSSNHEDDTNLRKFFIFKFSKVIHDKIKEALNDDLNIFGFGEGQNVLKFVHKTLDIGNYNLIPSYLESCFVPSSEEQKIKMDKEYYNSIKDVLNVTAKEFIEFRQKIIDNTTNETWIKSVKDCLLVGNLSSNKDNNIMFKHNPPNNESIPKNDYNFNSANDDPYSGDGEFSF